MKHLFIKIVTTYKTLVYVTLFLSLSLNYMTLKGKLDMVGYWKDSPSTVASSGSNSAPNLPNEIPNPPKKQVKKDFLSQIETQPVNLYKNNKKVL